MSKIHNRPTSSNKRHRRTTFKKHSKSYSKVYAPFIPALLIIGLSMWSLFASHTNHSQVLSLQNGQTAENLLEETNLKRQASGIHQLKLSSKLNSAAQAKAEDMVNKDYWSHISPNGNEPWVYFESSDYSYLKASENLAYGFKSSGSTINGWMNSPEHRKTMLDSDLQEVGFGVAHSDNFLGQGPENVVVGFYAKPSTQTEAGNALGTTTFASDKKVPFIETLGSWNNPFLNFSLGLLLGVGVMYLSVKHSLHLRRKLRKGEKYIIKHPVIDVTVVALVILSYALIQTAGNIH